MNSTQKAEMQVDELDDGGAAVLLPEGENNPQTVEDKTEEHSGNDAQNRDDDHDD